MYDTIIRWAGFGVGGMDGFEELNSCKAACFLDIQLAFPEPEGANCMPSYRMSVVKSCGRLSSMRKGSHGASTLMCAGDCNGGQQPQGRAGPGAHPPGPL